MSVGDIADRKERPAYARFEVRSIENKAESIKQGRYVARDVDFVIITPPYTKDTNIFRVDDWFRQMQFDVQNERLPKEWADNYRKQYDAWKSGQELPVEGTPIKGWGLASPSQQETLIRMHVRTVEDLAAMNDDGMRRFGMGAMEMKNKAIAWLGQADKGKTAARMAELESQNALLQANLETVTEALREATAAVNALRAQPAGAAVVRNEITASDLMDEEEPITQQEAETYKAKFGRPPHHRAKPSTIRRELGA